MHDSLPKRLDIISAKPFQVSIRHNRSRVIADHAATMSRTCPFRQEAALLIGIGKPRLHLRIHIRIHQVQEGEQATERIPKTGIGKHIPRQHFSVIRTVMYNFSVCIKFVEAAREKQRTIQAGIECA